jgi:hypothetical protein
MKKILYLLIAIHGIAFGQTIISTPSVSGTWTLAGSPYIVQTIITVQAGQVLTIEPGVIIKFQSSTKLEVNGQLIAAGTNSSPIIFQATDTVGWSNDLTVNGGWSGVHFHQYGGGGTDVSILDYCTIQDVKYGYGFPVMYSNALTTERGLKIHNCTIRHNTTGTSGSIADPPLFLRTYLTTDTIDVYNCILTDNTSVFGTIQSSNYGGGYTKISKCHIYQNYLGSGIYANLNNMLIENNEIDHNTMQNDAGPLRISAGEVIIRGNKIHHNQSDDYGGIACRSGRITIENNLVCNNRQDDAFCGITGGGAGINVAHNEGSVPFEDTYYIIRNNIVANNYAAYGGGGMYVFNARATISNNHIINNHTPGTGQGIMITHPNSEVYMKNNLFHTQSGPGNVDTVRAVYILSASKIQFDNNYIPSRFYKSVQAASGYTLVGDTLDNVVGIAPAMVAPTIDNNYTTNALTADFRPNATSPCINEGDTATAFPALTDFAGNVRIETIIDIGAFEYGAQPHLGIENIMAGNSAKMQVYPNPVISHSTVTVLTPEAEGKLVITDMNGKIVYEKWIDSEKQVINLEYERGMYLVYFYGKKTSQGKIVIQ